MRRLRIDVEYDGSDFAGWQRQRRQRSVQGVLEAAIAVVTGEEQAQVVGAGRTDAGVHATGQVAHFDTSWDRDTGVLRRALNAVLPEDVAVTTVLDVPPTFHARHSATARAYRYTVWTGAVRSPLVRRTSVHLAVPLSLEAMREGARALLGEHDFGAFGSAVTPDGSTVRRIDRLDVVRDGARVVFDCEANAFLRHQVRRCVGMLLDVGRGRHVPEAVLATLVRAPAAPVARRAPARGLVLVAVRYPPQVDDVAPVDGAIRMGSES